MKTSESGPRRSAGAAANIEPGGELADEWVHNPTLIGKTIKGRFRLTRLIGEGGMGVVYEAFDTQVERKVAIKLVRNECRTDLKFMTRFRRELEVTSQLRHPSTIRVFDHGQTADGRPYMVMELLTGESLADRLERGRIEEMEALQYARQIAASLSEAHGHGIFHRDLKPDNIFIEKMGVSTVVKVLDFGIAGGLDASRLTRAGEVFGTPQYMSPEQCNGQDLDHRTDVYSLGCILYEMIEGHPPFTAESPMATMLKHVRAKVPAPRHCSRETARILSLALRKDRSKRIQDCGRLAALIADRVSHGAHPGAEPSSVSLTRGARHESGFESRRSQSGHSHSQPGTAVGAGSAGTDAENVVAPQVDRGSPWVVPALATGFAIVVALLFFSDASWTEPEARSDDEASDDAKLAGVASAADRDPSQQDADAAETGSTADKKSPLNRAEIRVNVRNARVHLDGEFLCETPCEIQVPVGDDLEHEIRVEKDGYIPVISKWQPKTVTEPPPEFPNLRRTRRK